MQSIRSLSTFVIIIGALLAAGCQQGPTARGPKQANAAALQDGALIIQTRNGAVEVIVDPAASGVTIDGDFKCAGKTQQEADQRLADSSISLVHSTDGTLEVHAAFAGGERNQDGASLIVRLPNAKGVTIRSSNGGVTVNGTRGNLSVNTSNGPVKIEDHDGDAAVDTSNGSVKAVRVTGDVVLETSNSSVSVTDQHGTVNIDTSNGSVTVGLVDDNPGPVIVDTSNSSITVNVGPAFEGRVDMDTSNSRVTVDDPGERITASSLGRTEGHVIIGAETGQKSVLETSNSSIRLNVGH